MKEDDFSIATKIGEAIISIIKEQRPSEKVRKPINKIKYLYVLQSVMGGPVKIGISEFLDERIKTLQNGSPFKLIIVRTMAFDSINLSSLDTERCLHRELKDFIVRGEWFDEYVINILDLMAEKFQFDFYEIKEIFKNETDR